jgi:hypothetical protein
MTQLLNGPARLDCWDVYIFEKVEILSKKLKLEEKNKKRVITCRRAGLLAAMACHGLARLILWHYGSRMHSLVCTGGKRSL